MDTATTTRVHTTLVTAGLLEAAMVAMGVAMAAMDVAMVATDAATVDMEEGAGIMVQVM